MPRAAARLPVDRQLFAKESRLGVDGVILLLTLLRINSTT
jgi:hypothetical protein